MATDNPILSKAAGSQKAAAGGATADDLAYEAFIASRAETKSNSQLQDIEDALANNSSRTRNSVAQLEAGSQQTEMATSILKNSMESIAASTQIIQGATMAADLTAQNNTNAVLAAAGGTQEQIAQMQRLKSEGDNINRLQSERSAIMSEDITGLSIIDNVINTFRAIEVNTDLQTAGAQYNATVGHIQNVTSAQEGFHRINTINKQAINDSTIAANYKKIADTASYQAAEQDIKNVQTNADMLTRVMAADDRVVNNLLESYRLSGAVEQRAAAQERLDFDRDSMRNQREMWEFDKPRMALQMEQLELAMADSKAATPAKRATYAQTVKNYNEGLAFEAQTAEYIRKAQQSMGLPLETPEQVQFKLTNPSTRDKYIKLSEIGFTEKSTGQVSYGSSPYEAYSNLRDVDPDGRAAETFGSALLDNIATAQLDGYKALLANPPKDEATYRADFDKTADLYMSAGAKNIAAGDSTNPYQAPPMAVLERSAVVQNSALWQNVLAAKGLTTADPQVIMETAANGVAAKLLSPEEAAVGITQLFKVAVAYNNTAQGGFTRAGLGKYEQRTYNTTIKHVPSLYDTLTVKDLPLLVGAKVLGVKKSQQSEVINLLDKAAVQQAIIRQMNSRPIPAATTKPE